MLVTTLNKIKKQYPCKNSWKKLLRKVGKKKADNDELSFLTILEAIGLNDTLWCCRTAPEYDKEWRLFAVWCARQVQHLMIDERSINAVNVAERFANGMATLEELKEAGIAASEAINDALGTAASAFGGTFAWDSASTVAGVAAAHAALDTASTVAGVAASHSAREAASTVAGVAAANAALEAASTVAWDSALEAASSVASAVAWDSAYDAALEASWDSSRSAALEAASSAAMSAVWNSARNEALDAAIDAQKAQFIKVIT